MSAAMPLPPLDFSKLSLRDALDLAVLIEEEARDRYDELANQLIVHHTPEAAAFFAKMARVEEIHRQQLYDRRRRQFDDEPTSVNASMLFDIEAPDYDEARAFMTVRQALHTALKSETKAHDFFVQAINKVQDRLVVDLFTELREEEVEHQNLVKAELARLPPDAEGKTSDYADDPVGL